MIEIQLHKILNVSLCWDIVRDIRWCDGVFCPSCQSTKVVKNGKDKSQPNKQHYQCNSCSKYFDDLTDTIFSGSQHPIQHWITVLYMMNLNCSNHQIGKELDIPDSTIQEMCSKIREGVVKKNLIYFLAKKLNLTNVM